MKSVFPALAVALAAFAAPLFAQTGLPVITVQPRFDDSTTHLVAVNGVNYILIFVDAVDPSTPPSLTYQWRRNGGNITGAKSDMYWKSPVAKIDEGVYSVRIANAAGAVISSNVTVDVVTP